MGRLMHLSIVTGTHNRLASLQRMMASVRSQLPRHLRYEFVVVDGGSDDGTLAWLEREGDVNLIRHGKLKGAIRAFCDGAKAARGEYVLLANDDIEFHPYALARALVHMEEHPSCGAVAFADNRSFQSGHAARPRVEKMTAVSPDGKAISVNYAQVGLFRRWLGDRIGWWGADDPIIGKARTYGGDNFLSANLWELGYSVDAVAGCEVDDLIEMDALRDHNRVMARTDSAQYYNRFPRGPRVYPYPRIPNPQRERLRILVMDNHDARLKAREVKEQGLAEAFAEVGLVWHIDYLNEVYDLTAIAQAWRPHLVVTQMHGPGEHLNGEVFATLRQSVPDTVIVNWNGDAHEKGLADADTLEALRGVDLQTVVNAAVLPTYRKQGIRAAYWQIGYKHPAAAYVGEDVPAHTALFAGNCYNDERYALVKALRETGVDVGVYGNCPDADGNTHYDFAHQAALYSAATITVSDTFPGTEGFVSNRLFQALGAGAFVLQQYSPRLDELTGLRAGEHYILWRDLPDLKAMITLWKEPRLAEERAFIAALGQAFIREHFSYPAQVRKLWELL